MCHARRAQAQALRLLSFFIKRRAEESPFCWAQPDTGRALDKRFGVMRIVFTDAELVALLDDFGIYIEEVVVIWESPDD